MSWIRLTLPMQGNSLPWLLWAQHCVGASQPGINFLPTQLFTSSRHTLAFSKTISDRLDPSSYKY